ncbi:MAG: YdjY domain-containing protein [Thermodesulfobacteriota bacterium]
MSHPINEKCKEAAPVKKKAMRTLVMAALAMLCTLGNSFGQPAQVAPAPPPPPAEEMIAPPPPLRMIEPGIYEMGDIRISKEKQRLEFPAEVNMDKGLLEYVLVGNSGKVHESLLRTGVSPYALQISLLLLGVEGSLNPLTQQGEARQPQGGRVAVRVAWQEGGKEKKAEVEEWISKGDKPAGAIPWVFTGSVVMDGVFMAQVEKSIIALFHDPIALIDHQLAEGTSDEIWQVAGNVPPVGTKVTVVIEKMK